VVLSLDVGFHEAKTGAIEITCHRRPEDSNGTSEATGHRITLEFNAESSVPAVRKTGARVETQTAASTRIDPTEAPQVVQTLASIFGAPGFDSSARAAVFRDALADLSEPQAEIVIKSFSGTPVPEKEQAARRARGLIVKILRTGPLKSDEEGGEILAGLFGRYKLPAILNLIGREWKTQDNWMR
jgi:hypothetical protein